MSLSLVFFIFSKRKTHRVVGRDLKVLDSVAVRVGLESGLRRSFFFFFFLRSRFDDERVELFLFCFEISFFSFFYSYQPRELQNRAENGDDHPEHREAKRCGAAQGEKVTAVDLLGARGERRRRSRSWGGRGLDGRAGLLLREHFCCFCCCFLLVRGDGGRRGGVDRGGLGLLEGGGGRVAADQKSDGEGEREKSGGLTTPSHRTPFFFVFHFLPRSAFSKAEQWRGKCRRHGPSPLSPTTTSLSAA